MKWCFTRYTVGKFWFLFLCLRVKHKSLFWVPILAAGGPYFKAWGSLLVWLTVMYSCGFPQKVRWQNWWIPSVAPMTESVDSLSRSDAEIANKWIPSEGRMTELMDSLSSSDDRIGGCPQQVRCHLVLIWSILDPLTWFLTHFGPLRWILPVETSLSLGPIKSLSQ